MLEQGTRRFSRRRLLLYGALVPSGVAMGSLVHSTDYLAQLGGRATGARLERMLRSPQFHDGVFRNPGEVRIMAPGRGMEIAREWLRNRATLAPPAPLPARPLDRTAFRAPPASGLRLCWLGHSTVLIELEGRRLLCDPVWARRASPSSLVGPARFQPVPLPLDELPELSAVLISHDHYDHLDKRAIEELARLQPAVPFFVPLGVGAHLERWGIAPQRVREFDWWEEGEIEGLRVVASPAQHFSGRGIADRNKTLWTAWAMVGTSHRVFFGGDSGYFPGYAEIGRRLGPFDVTMLEIGAYHPSWGSIHLGPRNALLAHRDLGGRALLPIHWGTFSLGLHPWDEPIRELQAATAESSVKLLLPQLGELV